jgi:hypothetical protein
VNNPNEIPIQLSFYALRKRSETVDATIVLTSSGMTIHVPYEGDKPYVIVGHRENDQYTGSHVGSPDDEAVECRWTLLNKAYIGTWIEGGERWLISFEDPAQQIEDSSPE